VGSELIGKTYVLSAAFRTHSTGTAAAPEGIVYLYGRDRPLADLLQSVWEACYDGDPATVPSETQIRRDLVDRELLVVVDSCELSHADGQALAAALAHSRVILVSRERRWWDGQVSAIGGLGAGDALALLERELGTALVPDDQRAATVLCERLAGHPVSLKQAAALVRDGESTLEELATRLPTSQPEETVATAALARSSPRERQVLAALAAFEGEAVGSEFLDELLGSAASDVAAKLVDRGLLRRGSPRYALTLPPGAIGTLDPETSAAAERRAIELAASASPAMLDAEVGALLALWGRLRERRDEALLLRLGQTLVPSLIRTRRFAGWRSVVERVGSAAEALGDRAAQAWALHEAGTQAVAVGDRTRGVQLLRAALTQRRALHYRAGIRATRHNLRLITPPPWSPGNLSWVPMALLVVVVGAAILFGVGRLVDLDGGATAPAEPAATKGRTTRRGCSRSNRGVRERAG
jgi:hypothetical protein